MDNDNKLVQKAADLYRSMRFSMKYRGLTILSAEAGNDAIAAAIAAGAPYMAAPLRRYRDAHRGRLPALRRRGLCRKNTAGHSEPFRRVPHG